MTLETPQFFPNRQGKRLYGIAHEPAEPRHNFAVVYCAPLLEEKLWSHRVMVNFARFLSARGVGTLRFDYFGDGESEGLFEDASVKSRVEDIVDAVEFCKQRIQTETVYLLGLCYGAVLALCAASQASAVAGLVGWAPVMDGRRYVSDVLRAHLTTQMVTHRKIIHDREALIAQIEQGQTVNVEGYEIGRPLYAEMTQIDVLERLRSIAKPVLLQQIAPAERIDSAYAALQQLGNPVVEFKAMREDKFWLQQKAIFPPCDELFEQTLRWLIAAAAR